MKHSLLEYFEHPVVDLSEFVTVWYPLLFLPTAITFAEQNTDELDYSNNELKG